LQREAEHERLLGARPSHSSHPLRHMVARLGTFLIALCTRLRQLEQPRKSMAIRLWRVPTRVWKSSQAKWGIRHLSVGRCVSYLISRILARTPFAQRSPWTVRN